MSSGELVISSSQAVMRGDDFKTHILGWTIVRCGRVSSSSDYIQLLTRCVSGIEPVSTGLVPHVTDFSLPKILPRVYSMSSPANPNASLLFAGYTIRGNVQLVNGATQLSRHLRIVPARHAAGPGLFQSNCGFHPIHPTHGPHAPGDAAWEVHSRTDN